MASMKARLVGVELYFEDLQRSQRFYHESLGLDLEEATAGHHAKFAAGDAFLCLERKGAESYPSKDKAVLFFEVEDLKQAVEVLGINRIVHYEPNSRTPWAVLHDPEGHNILLLQASGPA
jgi:predicted enzyme related to lactoylglutathione lyase